LISLNTHLESNYIKSGGINKSDAVMLMAADLEASYSTVYKWLKCGDYFVANSEASTPTSCDSSITVFKVVRHIEA
jgi:hypothetical protein